MQVAHRIRSCGGGIDHLQLVKGLGRFESRQMNLARFRIPAGYSVSVAQ
jgi:hypothetical protein